MYATVKGADTGVSPEVAKEFIQSTPADSYKKLPAYTHHHEAKKRALGKMSKGY